MSHFNDNEDFPGPGTYFLNHKHVLLRAPTYPFGLRPDLWFDYDKPGPGTYNVRKDGNTSPKYSMAQHCFGVSGLKTPGPGTYYLNNKHTHIRVPSYTMSCKSNYHPDEGLPGPGTYDLRAESPLFLPGYTLGKRFHTRGSCTPGPGHYSPSASPSASPHYSLARHCSYQSRPLTPVVGTYTLRSPEFSGPMFTIAQRFYRIKNRVEHCKQERRFSASLKSRPKQRSFTSTSPAGAAALKYNGLDVGKRATVFSAGDLDHVNQPHEDMHSKDAYGSHFHYKPDIPKQASKLLQSTSTLMTQVLPPLQPPAPAASSPLATPPPALSNAWMAVGHNLQRIRTRVTAAASAPEPPPPPVPAPPADPSAPLP